jgi:hypothetical protein
MLAMMQKRDDFAGWLEDLLQVHDARFFVDTLERKAIEQGIDRKTRLSAIPDPVRYAAMQDIGQTLVLPDGIDASGNVCEYLGHRFDLHVFWGKLYGTTYAAHSQSLFEAMVYNASDAVKPGVLATIRESRHRTVAGLEYHVGSLTGDAFENVTRGSYDFGDLGAPDLAHRLSFTITLY